MKLIIQLVTIIIIVTSFGGCNNNSKNDTNIKSSQNQNRLKLNKVRSLSLDNNPDMGTIGRLRIDFKINRQGERFLFWDITSKQLILTTNDGKIINIAGGKGKGPREFQREIRMNFKENGNIIAFDIVQQKINNYDSHLEYLGTNSICLDTKNLYPSGRGFVITDSSYIIPILQNKFIAPEQWWESALFAKVDPKTLKVKDIMGRYDNTLKHSKVYWNTPILNILTDRNYIVSTHQSLQRIQVFDIKTGELIARLNPDNSTMFQKPTEEISPELNRRETTKKSIGLSFTQQIYVMDDYILLFYGNLTEKFVETRNAMDREYYISIYDKSFSYIKDIPLNAPLGAVKNNKLFLIENNSPDNYKIDIYVIES